MAECLAKMVSLIIHDDSVFLLPFTGEGVTTKW